MKDYKLLYSGVNGISLEWFYQIRTASRAQLVYTLVNSTFDLVSYYFLFLSLHLIYRRYLKESVPSVLYLVQSIIKLDSSEKVKTYLEMNLSWNIVGMVA
uniref:Uncharacterized protein n=1 Tax=Cacopsylla melanoneura TaxID=428564 RepID=A0A8D8X1T8_9HEMI